MARQQRTQSIVEHAREVLEGYHPMSLRQVYYRLVAQQIIPNTIASYRSLSGFLVNARRDGIIPWEWLEDRTRVARSSDGSYDSLADFARFIQYYYSRDFWSTQEKQVEVWEEKDALSGVFSDALAPYRVTYNIGKGFDGWDSIYKASRRYGTGENVTVLYFGDFDPSGEEMCTSLKKRLAELGSYPTIQKIALTKADVVRYDLPYDPAKVKDPRRDKFVEQHGDMSVELDALPPDILQARIVEEVEKYVDKDALAAVKALEQEERKQIVEVLKPLGGTS
jgi:hypothetical protein